MINLNPHIFCMYSFRICIKKSCAHRKMCIYFKFFHLTLAYSAIFYFFVKIRQISMSALISSEQTFD